MRVNFISREFFCWTPWFYIPFNSYTYIRISAYLMALINLFNIKNRPASKNTFKLVVKENFEHFLIKSKKYNFVFGFNYQILPHNGNKITFVTVQYSFFKLYHKSYSIDVRSIDFVVPAVIYLWRTTKYR